MIRQTFKRIEALAPPERVYVVIAENHLNLLKEHLPELPLQILCLSLLGEIPLHVLRGQAH